MSNLKQAWGALGAWASCRQSAYLPHSNLTQEKSCFQKHCAPSQHSAAQTLSSAASTLLAVNYGPAARKPKWVQCSYVLKQ